MCHSAAEAKLNCSAYNDLNAQYQTHGRKESALRIEVVEIDHVHCHSYRGEYDGRVADTR